MDALETLERRRRSRVGLYRTKDTRRDPTVGDWDDEYIYHYRRWTLAPTKLEVSFSYIF